MKGTAKRYWTTDEVEEHTKRELSEFKKQLRIAVANYMRSEGCSCCRDYEAHERHTEVLGKLLNVPKYSDGSGRDFSKYRND